MACPSRSSAIRAGRPISGSGAINLEYQADAWGAPRRVVLVVQEWSDDLFLHPFFIVTNLSKFEVPPEQVLAIYRRRGKAEAHMSELKLVLNVHLSSTDRGASTVQQIMARNQVSLLLSLMAYQMMHALRGLLEWQTRQGWSLARLREQVLKVAATITVHTRRITVRLGVAAARWWSALLKTLPRLTRASHGGRPSDMDDPAACHPAGCRLGVVVGEKSTTKTNR